LQTCPRVVIRRDWQTTRIPNEIAIVSGGGAGHEPFANGLVGKGMLTAAVTGNIFASPPTVHISAALDAVANAGKTMMNDSWHRSVLDGILVIINNYTGDRLNFGLSVERFNHQYAGCARIVLVGDDTALQSDDLSAGRRGLVGSTFVIKVS
jgi:dihydroxyacetone kinase